LAIQELAVLNDNTFPVLRSHRDEKRPKQGLKHLITSICRRAQLKQRKHRGVARNTMSLIARTKLEKLLMVNIYLRVPFQQQKDRGVAPNTMSLREEKIVMTLGLTSSGHLKMHLSLKMGLKVPSHLDAIPSEVSLTIPSLMKATLRNKTPTDDRIDGIQTPKDGAKHKRPSP
jgi:hypothetical protein